MTTQTFERYMDNALNTKQQFIQVKLMEINTLQHSLKNRLEVEIEGKLPCFGLSINQLNYHMALQTSWRWIDYEFTRISLKQFKRYVV